MYVNPGCSERKINPNLDSQIIQEAPEEESPKPSSSCDRAVIKQITKVSDFLDFQLN